MSRGKRRGESTTGSVAPISGRRYSNPLLGSKKAPSGMMKPENAEPSTAVDIKTVVLQVKESGVLKIPCVMAEFAKILL